MKIVPAILTDNPGELKTMINACEEVFESAQIDIIDGVFADNKTVEPSSLGYIETNLKLDFQLMVKEPINWVEQCIRAGAERIIGHVELMEDQFAFVEKVSEEGRGVGFGLDLGTPVDKIHPKLLTSLDVVLLMSVKAGFGGQNFNNSVYSKIEGLMSIKKEFNADFIVIVDGGVKPDLIKKLALAGVDEVAVGRSLVTGNIEKNLQQFNDQLVV